MNCLTFYVIYSHPEDYPELFVVRTQIVCDGRVSFGMPQFAHTLADAQALLPPGLTQLQLDPNDSPSIAQVWLQ